MIVAFPGYYDILTVLSFLSKVYIYLKDIFLVKGLSFLTKVYLS